MGNEGRLDILTMRLEIPGERLLQPVLPALVGAKGEPLGRLPRKGGGRVDG